MLVLMRKPGEAITLTPPNGEIITIYLTENHGYQARLGIDAPPDVHILRSELSQ